MKTSLTNALYEEIKQALMEKGPENQERTIKETTENFIMREKETSYQQGFGKKKRT